MLASTEKELCINPFQALIETISAREILEKQLEQENNISHGYLKIHDLESYITERVYVGDRHC